MLVHSGVEVDVCRSLDEIRDDIFAAVDDMVFRVGELLYEAKLAHPGRWKVWVERELPFGYDKAKRMVTVYLAFAHLPDDVKARLPRAWQALYALASRPDEVVAGVERGEIGPDTTVVEAAAIRAEWSGGSKRFEGQVNERTPMEPRWSEADVLAYRLLDLDPLSLTDWIADKLGGWLRSRAG